MSDVLIKQPSHRFASLSQKFTEGEFKGKTLRGVITKTPEKFLKEFVAGRIQMPLHIYYLNKELQTLLGTMNSQLSKMIINYHGASVIGLEQSFTLKPAKTKNMVDVETIASKKVKTIGIGKLPQFLFRIQNIVRPSSYFNDVNIEEFVNQYKASYAMRYDDKKDFIISDKLVDFKWAYYSKNYVPGGKLGKSCMRGLDAQGALGFYVANGAKIIFLKINEKCAGRAILWEHTYNVTTNSVISYLDRQYTCADYLDVVFKKFAADNNFYLRSFYNGGRAIITPQGSEGSFNFIRPMKAFRSRVPYIDTMRCVYDIKAKIIYSYNGLKNLTFEENRFFLANFNDSTLFTNGFFAEDGKFFKYLKTYYPEKNS